MIRRLSAITAPHFATGDARPAKLLGGQHVPNTLVWHNGHAWFADRSKKTSATDGALLRYRTSSTGQHVTLFKL